MKRMTAIFGIITFMLGCATLPKSYIPLGHKFTSSNSNLSCQDLYEDIPTKWGHHKDFKTCYFYNEKLVDEITRRSTCFLNFNREDVKNMFGEPTIVSNGRYKFNLSKDCEQIDTLFSMHSLYFEFSDSLVEKVYHIKASTIN